MFELTNAATQGRLPNKQDFRCSAKTTLICRDDSASQLRKVNSRYSILEVHVAKSPFADKSKVSINVARNVKLESSTKNALTDTRRICNRMRPFPPRHIPVRLKNLLWDDPLL